MKWSLGNYKVEAAAAAARDMIARILGLPLNFEKPREITGQRSESADQTVADAVKAANALMLGTHNLRFFYVFPLLCHKTLTVYPTLCVLTTPS